MIPSSEFVPPPPHEGGARARGKESRRGGRVGWEGRAWGACLDAEAETRQVDGAKCKGDDISMLVGVVAARRDDVQLEALA